MADFLPKSVPHGGLILARGDHFWGPILADFFAKIGPPWGTDFGKRGPFLAAKIGPAGPNLAAKVVRGDRFWQLFFAKISPAGPVLGGTDFGVTVQSVKCYDSGLRSTELIDRPKYVCILQKDPVYACDLMPDLDPDN